MPRSITRLGIAENRAQLFMASRNCARQKMTSKVYRLTTLYLCGILPSTRVCAGDSTGASEDGGGNILLALTGRNGVVARGKERRREVFVGGQPTVYISILHIR